MTPTFATLLFLPLAAWGVVRPRRVITLLAATVGFSGTAVFNLPALAFGFQPYHLFGSILIVRCVVAALAAEPTSPARRSCWPVTAFAALWMTAVISLFAASGVRGGPGGAHVLIAQIAHLGFGVAVAWALSVEAHTAALVGRGARAFELGAVAIASWGLLQFLCNRLGLSYPAFVFNNSVGRYADNFDSTIGPNGVVRVGSVATEPSFLARTLVMALGLAVVRRAWREPTGGRRRLVIATILTAGVLVSTSTTGLFGLGVLAALGLARGRSVRARSLIALIAGVAVAILVLSPSLSIGLREMTIDKSSSGSFEQRQASTDQAQELFLDYPLLGVGLGGQTSHELFSKIASNLGLAGLAAYAVAVVGLLTLGRSGLRRERATMLGLKVALAMSILMDTVAGWSYTYGEFWVVAGLLLAGASTVHRTTSIGPSTDVNASKRPARVLPDLERRRAPP